METSVVLSRKMGNFSITQRTSDGYFDANALLTQWNSVKENPVKRIGHFTENEKTSEFINEIQSRNSDNGDLQPLIKSKGRMTLHGKTSDKVWMHPFLFIDFSMWLSPEFKYDVIKFVYDELIKQRNEAGDSYKEMSTAIAKIVPKKDIQTSIQKIAQAVNFIAFNEHETAIRNRKGESEMKELVAIEKQVASLINDGFIKSFDQLHSYLQNKWRKKYQPSILS